MCSTAATRVKAHAYSDAEGLVVRAASRSPTAAFWSAYSRDKSYKYCEGKLTSDKSLTALAMSYSRLAQSHHEPLGTSSAVASVLFTRGGEGHQVTKSGSYIYWGDAANFHEWVFRTELRARAAGTDPTKYAEVMSRIVDGLYL